MIVNFLAKPNTKLRLAFKKEPGITILFYGLFL